MSSEEDTPICPSCGAADIQVTLQLDVAKSPYGPSIPLEYSLKHCLTCDTVFDNTGASERAYEAAEIESSKKSIELILNYLTSQNDYNLLEIERALDLPHRTVSRWKTTGEITSMGLALLRILRTFPWILKVARAKYESKEAQKIFIEEAINAVREHFYPEKKPDQISTTMVAPQVIRRRGSDNFFSDRPETGPTSTQLLVAGYR